MRMRSWVLFFLFFFFSVARRSRNRPTLHQLVTFGLSNQMVVNFKEENLMTFKHLFLKNYADGEMSRYAVYRQDDLYDHIRYTIEQVTEFKICFFFLFVGYIF